MPRSSHGIRLRGSPGPPCSACRGPLQRQPRGWWPPQVVGVLIDCFVTTKLLIPCCMALIPDRANLWPRRARAAPGKQRQLAPADGEAAVAASVSSEP